MRSARIVTDAGPAIARRDEHPPSNPRRPRADCSPAPVEVRGTRSGCQAAAIRRSSHGADGR